MAALVMHAGPHGEGSTVTGAISGTRKRSLTVRPSPNVVFELRRLETGGLVRRYVTEGAALAFVRDVVRIGGREQAASFILNETDEHGLIRTIDKGGALVRRALEDRAE